MMKKASLVPLFTWLLISSDSFAMMADDPWIAQFEADELEYRKSGGDALKVWDLQFSLGRDLQQWSLEWQGEADESEIEGSELGLYYAQAISPYWNATLGLSHDARPQPKRSWMQFGIEGLAAYFVDVDVEVLLDEHGEIGLRVQLEREWMLSQRWQMNSELEFSAYGQRDVALDIDSGVQKVELGLRLAYGITRQFAPYAGVVYEWENSLQQSSKDETWAVLGVEFWF